MERPTFGTVLPGSRRPIERTFALATVEACQVPAAQRHPSDIVRVDIHPARRISLYLRLGVVPRDLVIFCHCRFRRICSWIQSHDSAGEAQYAAPDHSVG